MRIAFSPDGLHWTPYDGNPVLPDFGEEWFMDDPRRPYGVGDIIDIVHDPYRTGTRLRDAGRARDNLYTGPGPHLHPPSRQCVSNETSCTGSNPGA